ncbi:VWA domain-containing protein [Candidatus Nitrospira bockiana]
MERLIERLTKHMERREAVAWVTEVQRSAGSPALSGILVLLDELEELSAKCAAAAVEAFAALRRREALASILPWLDLGVAISAASGAAGLKYFKESPPLVALMPASVRGTALEHALELAEADSNVALEFMRQAQDLLAVLPAEALARWCELGLELTRADYVLGMEFFRQSPRIAEAVPEDHLRSWIAFGTKLITQNSLGKPDYVGTLEFFRRSPGLLREITGAAPRKGVIDLGSALADRDPAAAGAMLAESPQILARLPSEEWRTRVLQYGLFVAGRDSEAALHYLRRCPEVLERAGSAEARLVFEEWYRGGMTVLELSAEGGRAYFALETRKALTALEEAGSAVPLRRVTRMLKLFAEGLCGREISIRAQVDTAGSPPRPRLSLSAETAVIGLPEMLQRYPTREGNIRLYTVMTAHEAGRLVFGTYQLSWPSLGDLITEVRTRYGGGDSQVHTLGELFRLYPQPALIRDLWMILEDARIEHHLQDEYPGLAKDLAVLARDLVATRTLDHGMTAKEMVVDCLLLMTTAEPGTVRIPDALTSVVVPAWDLARQVLTRTATAADAVRTADRLYVLLDRMVAGAAPREGSDGADAQPASAGGPPASEDSGAAYRPVTNWSYRGEMDPDWVQDRGARDGDRIGASSAGTTSGERDEPGEREDSPRAVPQGEAREGARGEDEAQGDGGREALLGDEGRPRLPAGQAFLYDEWDGSMQDYRSGWCRVTERLPGASDSDFVDRTLSIHGPSIRVLRRYFESLKPSGLRRLFGQADGEELDLDAVVRRLLEHAAGVEGTERVYLQRDKREREVAVAFLVDLSGSTSRQIDSAGRRIIDVEKEALVLLSEAVEAIGDQYAIYGYSSRGRRAVDFLLLKEFDESVVRSSPRIGAIAPLQQNRDGAAIRHAARKLMARDARVRLLILISDGKPLDEGYADEYALEDTKKALRELRGQGIHSCCITVDQRADHYLKRMYGDVRYIIIDRVDALPARLPRIYQRLTA